jgi:hypothetical protein
MGKLTKNQLTQLGDSYLRYAQAIGNYRINNYGRMSTLMRTRSREYYNSLNDYSNSFYLAGTNYIIDEAEASIVQMKDVAQGLDKAIAKVEKVHTAVKTIGAAVQLGAAIISKQPIATIAASLKQFVKSYKKVKDAT